MYFEDHFQKPSPFAPDVVVPIDDVIEKKLDMIDAHVSQMYEWLPWLNGALDQVPKEPAARRQWLGENREFRVSPVVRDLLVKQIGAEAAAKVRYAEAFEVTEYGRRADQAELKRLFPFSGK